MQQTCPRQRPEILGRSLSCSAIIRFFPLLFKFQLALYNLSSLTSVVDVPDTRIPQNGFHDYQRYQHHQQQ